MLSLAGGDNDGYLQCRLECRVNWGVVNGERQEVKTSGW